MAKKQTRRSISVNRKLHDEVTARCKTDGVAVSQFTERALQVALGWSSPVARPTVVLYVDDPAVAIEEAGNEAHREAVANLVGLPLPPGIDSHGAPLEVDPGEPPDDAHACPACGEWVEGMHELGVLAHLARDYANGCGYCAHPSRDEGVCGICGDVRKDPDPALVEQISQLGVVDLGKPGDPVGHHRRRIAEDLARDRDADDVDDVRIEYDP